MNSPRTDIAPFCDRIKSSRPQRPKGSKRQQVGDHPRVWLQKFMKHILSVIIPCHSCSNTNIYTMTITMDVKWWVWNEWCTPHPKIWTHSGLNSDLEPRFTKSHEPHLLDWKTDLRKEDPEDNMLSLEQDSIRSNVVQTMPWLPLPKSPFYHKNMCGISRWYFVSTIPSGW